VFPTDPVFASQIRAELDRILGSEIFARSERLSSFLKFIVERTLSGEAGALKEQVIAIEVYGKAPDFNTAADPIVRVDARRLRDKLREYYATRGPGETVISVPKGSYTPAFTMASAVIIPGHAASPRASPMWWIAGAIGLSIVLLGAWLAYTRIVHQRGEPVRLLTVTSLPGAEEDPSMSPDGNFVAFSWSEAGTLDNDIWIKAVEGDAKRRLTDTPDANEKYPAWSRDGQRIAFTRSANDTTSVWIASAIGGSERMIAERSRYGSWLPDSKSLVVVSRSPDGRSSIVRYELESGAAHQLTDSPVEFFDAHPQVSPDGKSVVFTRRGAGRSAVFLKSLSGGDEIQLVEWVSGVVGGLTWSPDGREVIYARPELSGRRLARLTVASRDPPVPVQGAPLGSAGVSASPFRDGGRYRLAVVNGHPDISLRLIDLQALQHGDTVGVATTFCDATRMDVPGRFSPDSSQVAFVSDRSGTQQVWVAGRDQSRQRSVTSLQNASVNIGSWSPDGRSIAFDATIDGNTDIYIVSADGGPLTRLTNSPAMEMDPEWSRDGRSIYFTSNETGRSEIWKMAADGRSRLKLTSTGGFDPRESADGRFVYFAAAPRTYGLGPLTTLERISVDGGAASRVHSGVAPGAWGLVGNTVMFLVGGAEGQTNPGPDVVAKYDAADGRVHELGLLPFRVGPFGADRFFIVSPDGRWALAAHIDSWNRDIFVFDNFR
jgi:Tol biopolymer transport system component